VTSSSENELTVEGLRPELKRTHYCGDLSQSDVGKQVVVNGWVHKVRDLGGLVFVDLRDRSGIVQLAVDVQQRPELAERCKQLRSEFVVSAAGKVELRPQETKRDEAGAGAIEVRLESLALFSRADVPPFVIQDDVKAKDELRLRYRYLDLRRPVMAKRLTTRHVAMQETRRVLSEAGFLEVETPFLIRSTPEGARDYLVPSRVRQGSFYALPQSPQLLKQLLMVGGIDRYFQIARCFRDEDLRANRQPEFTQIDIEMSFGDESDVFDVAERVVCAVYKKVLGVEMTRPFLTMTFDEAMSLYGSDCPDVRYELKLSDVTERFRDSSFVPFAEAVGAGERVVGLCVPGGSGYSRKVIDSLSAIVRPLGVFGLVWVKLSPDGVKSSMKKETGGSFAESLIQSIGAKQGDMLLLGSGPRLKLQTAMGRLRQHLAREAKLIPEGRYVPLWVTEFPLFEMDEETGETVPKHHPFTSILPEDEPLLETDPLRVRGRLYDLVVNDQEIASGSVRIFDPELQQRVLKTVGIGEEEARRRFGFFLDALRFGTPPHCGIAFGFDRMVMQLCGVNSISEVIAFPKTTAASCLMTNAPAPVDEAALDELGLRLKSNL